MIEYTLGFIFTPDGKQVLLLERGEHDFHAHLHNGIGGKINIGESPTEAIVREAKEETGLRISEENWGFVGVLTAPEWKVWVFAAAHPYTEMNHTTPEGTLSWNNSEELPTTIVSNLTWLIPFCIDKLSSPNLQTLAVWYKED